MLSKKAIQEDVARHKEHDWFNPKNPLTEPVKELEFVTDGFCAKGMVTIIGAAPGAGKSMLVQYVLSRHGNDFLPTKKGTKAIYMAGADSSATELYRRARAIRVNDGLETLEPPEDRLIYFTDEHIFSKLSDRLKKGNYDAIVFDTAADYHHGNTYDADIVNASMAAVRRFAADANVAVIIITHTRKGSKIKNTYDVEDISDSRIWTSKSDFVFAIKSEYQDGGNLIELQNLKSRAPKALKPKRGIFQLVNGLFTIEPTEQRFKGEMESLAKDEQHAEQVRQVHELSNQGKTIKQISDRLGIATGTVSKYKKEPLPE